MEFFTSSIFCERERFGPEGRPYVCWLTGLALRPTKVDLGRPQVRPRSPDRSIFNGISNLKSLGFESHFILLATFTEVTNSKTKMTKSLRSSTASKLAVKRAQRQFPEWHFPKRRINHNIFFFFFFGGGGNVLHLESSFPQNEAFQSLVMIGMVCIGLAGSLCSQFQAYLSLPNQSLPSRTWYKRKPIVYDHSFR